MTDTPTLSQLEHAAEFASRHIGVADGADEQRMLEAVGYSSMDDLLADAVPASIREKLVTGPPAGARRRPTSRRNCASSPGATGSSPR